MMELLEFNFDNGSAAAVETLERIMCSYRERGMRALFTDFKPLELFLMYVWHGDIKIYKGEYVFDHDIRANKDAMKAYQQIAPYTRWRTYTTGITECIRINALWHFKDCGEPFYDEYVFYPLTKDMLHCGNINLHEFLMMGDLDEDDYNLTIFTYPYYSENGMNNYYKIETSPLARRAMKKYRNELQERNLELMRKISERNQHIYPKID